MRTLMRNKQTMHYAVPTGRNTVEYVIEDGHKVIAYTDEQGNVYYADTGEPVPEYDDVVEFSANIALSGGEAEAQEFGLSIADYNAVIVSDIDKFPIKNGTLIWHESPVKYKDEEQTVLDTKSADYIVLKVSPSLNSVRYVLKAVVK